MTIDLDEKLDAVAALLSRDANRAFQLAYLFGLAAEQLDLDDTTEEVDALMCLILDFSHADLARARDEIGEVVGKVNAALATGRKMTPGT